MYGHVSDYTYTCMEQTLKSEQITSPWNLFTQGNHTQVQDSVGGYYDCSHIAYCFTVRHTRGKENIADTLSHLTDQHTKSCAKLCTETKGM